MSDSRPLGARRLSGAGCDPCPVAADVDLAIALAREVLHRSGALKVTVALDADPAAIVECARLRAVVVTDEQGRRELAHDAAADVQLPELPMIRQLPPFQVQQDSGEVAGVLGGLEMLARALRDVAALAGGRSVVAADFETTDPDTTLGLAGRPGEPVVVLLGEEEYELEV